MSNPRQTIPEEYRRAFQDNVEQAIQQDTAKLASQTRVMPFSGKEKVYHNLEETSVEVKGRLQKSTPVEAGFYNRKATKTEYKKQFIFDQNDDEFLAELGTPTGEVITSILSARARLIDTLTVQAVTATVYGGPEPYTTALTLPSAQQVAVDYVASGSAANSGLTPQKIIKAVSILEEGEVDPLQEEVCITINPKMKLDLMTYVETSPNDVWANMVSAWLEGKDKKLFGLTPVMTNRVENDSATDIDTCCLWSKSRGIYSAPGGVKTHIDIRADLDHATQVSVYFMESFLRRYDEAVATIACDRTP